MKFAAARPWSDTEKAARKLPENDVEVVQDGRIYIEDKLASIWRIVRFTLATKNGREL